VPARRKFLRTQATELGHLRSAFILQALAHPELGMALTVDGRAADRLPGSPDLSDRVRDIFGGEMLQRLRRIEFSREGVRVSGLAGLPVTGRSDRSEQFVFVNGRPTSAPVVANGIREAYHALAAPGTYPPLFLFVDVDPGEVDVNVHPTKREVRFRNSMLVRDVVIEGIRHALGSVGSKPSVPGSGAVAPADVKRDSQPPGPELAIEDLPPTRVFRYPRLPQIQPAVPATGPTKPAGSGGGLPEMGGAAPWSWCRVLGQVGGLYAVLETEDGLVLMDPHAAHERVMFERFMKAFESGSVPTQRLLIPENVHLQPGDAAMVRRGLKVMNEMGFSVSDFGGDSFMVDGLPGQFAGAGAMGIMIEIAGHLEEAGSRGGGRTRWREEAIARAACRAAVKARDRLSLDEIEKLVIDLAGSEMPYTCPHGRPTLIFLSFDELHRKFGRA
jgi:DNA mismatch repair protein MutL